MPPDAQHPRCISWQEARLDILAALDALAPGRVWFVYQYGPERLALPDSALAYLERRGDELARISDLRGMSPAEAVLYELEEAGAR